MPDLTGGFICGYNVVMEKNHYEGHRWKYKGFTIWCFDGYYDIHEHPDAHPLAEGIATAREARQLIDERRRWNALETKLNTMRWKA